MEKKTENELNSLNTSEEIKNKAREELNRQLQGFLNDAPIENPTDDNIEDEVNRLMNEVDIYEKNYIPKEIDIKEFNDLKKFEEEFGQEEFEDSENEEDEKEEISTSTNIKEINREKNDKTKKNKKNQNDKKKIFDLNLKNEDLEDKKDYKINKKKNNNMNNNNIMQDKEIKELLNEYEKQLNIEVEREVEKEFKPKMDENDIKRAEILLKKDPLINEALIQGIITKEELILFIDYYEIFSLTNKAKKVTVEHLRALDDLCLKDKNKEKEKEKEDELNENEKKNKKTNYDLNDEDAINKLTKEIEKKLENSENIFNRKLDYEKIIKNKDINDDIKNEFFKIKNREKKNKEGVNVNAINNSSDIDKNIKNDINEEDRRDLSAKSEISTFTTEELMSVPKYTINKTNTKGNNTNSINSKTFYENIQNNNNNNKDNEIFKPKTPLNPISKDKNTINKFKNTNNNINLNNSSLSYVGGKKTIPPIKNNLKPKSNKRVDLFDDDGNPLNIGKNRDARKELIKIKMGGKSKMHELFTNKPRNKEENEKLRQKFIDFIQVGKENNKNNEVNSLKKSIVRKKIEDAQMFNKYKK